jgi:hypothetical protein
MSVGQDFRNAREIPKNLDVLGDSGLHTAFITRTQIPTMLGFSACRGGPTSG